MNHGRDCAHLYHEDGTLRDPMKPCKPEENAHAKANPGASIFGEVVEGCKDCALERCGTCGRTIRKCGKVGANGCEFCTPFPDLGDLDGCDIHNTDHLPCSACITAA